MQWHSTPYWSSYWQCTITCHGWLRASRSSMRLKPHMHRTKSRGCPGWACSLYSRSRSALRAQVLHCAWSWCPAHCTPQGRWPTWCYGDRHHAVATTWVQALYGDLQGWFIPRTRTKPTLAVYILWVFDGTRNQSCSWSAPKSQLWHSLVWGSSPRPVRRFLCNRLHSHRNCPVPADRLETDHYPLSVWDPPPRRPPTIS